MLQWVSCNLRLFIKRSSRRLKPGSHERQAPIGAEGEEQCPLANRSSTITSSGAAAFAQSGTTGVIVASRRAWDAPPPSSATMRLSTACSACSCCRLPAARRTTGVASVRWPPLLADSHGRGGTSIGLYLLSIVLAICAEPHHSILVLVCQCHVTPNLRVGNMSRQQVNLPCHRGLTG